MMRPKNKATDQNHTRILSLHNLKHPLLGYAALPLQRPSLTVDHFDLYNGDTVPKSIEGYDAIISWGGEHSVRERSSHNYIIDEQALLSQALAVNMPVLGVCLGAQILANTLGTPIQHMPSFCLGLREVQKLDSTRNDAIFAELPHTMPAIHWHEDYFELPSGATELLSRSGTGCEAFRYGENAWGLQFHPEASMDALFQWRHQASKEAPKNIPAADAAILAAAQTDTEREAVGQAIFSRFIDVAQKYAAAHH